MGDFDKCHEACDSALELAKETFADFKIIAKWGTVLQLVFSATTTAWIEFILKTFLKSSCFRVYARHGNCYMKEEKYKEAVEVGRSPLDTCYHIGTVAFTLDSATPLVISIGWLSSDGGIVASYTIELQGLSDGEPRTGCAEETSTSGKDPQNPDRDGVQRRREG